MTLEVWDATGNKRISVEVPGDVAVERILLVLADKLHLPRHSPDGELMSYKLHHRRLGVQLRDDQSLDGQGVIAGDVVRIQPEITAGRGAGSDTQRDRGPGADRDRERDRECIGQAGAGRPGEPMG